MVGYNPSSTKTKSVPICSGYLEVTSQVGICVVLHIHEAPFLETMPFCLLSEYQIRDYGLIVDSTAPQHKGINSDSGKHRIQLSSDVYVPMHNQGGLMGITILPWEQNDEDKYEVFTLTADKPWLPRKQVSTDMDVLIHTTSSTSTPCNSPDDTPFSSEWSTEYVDSSHVTEILTQVQEWMSTTPEIHALTLKSWHRMNPQHIPPEKLSPFLGFAPLRRVQETINKTTQLAKMTIRHPLRCHFSSRFSFLCSHKLNETVSTDYKFANCKCLGYGYTGCLLYTSPSPRDS